MYSEPSPRKSRVTAVDLSLDEHSHRAWIRSVPELDPVYELLESRMKNLGYPQVDCFAVNLVLRKAVLNSLRYAQEGDPKKTVQITFAVRPDEAVIEIEEQITSSDTIMPVYRSPSEKIDLNQGWGKFMTQSYATWMCVDPPGNRLSFGRRRSPE